MLLGVRVKKVDDGSIPKWDDEVSFYLIYNNGEQGRAPLSCDRQ